MFSATRLQVFVCLALGIAVQAAPASPAIARHTDLFDGGLSDTLDDNLGDNLSNELNVGFDDNFGDDSGVDFDGDFGKRQPIHSNVLGGSGNSGGLLSGLDLSNVLSGSGSAAGSADASTGTSGGLLDGLDLGNLNTNVAANVGLDASASKRQILEDIFDQGNDVLNQFGGGLLGDGSTDTFTDTSTDGTSTDSSTDRSTDGSSDSSSDFGGLLSGLGGSGSAGLGSNFGFRRQLGANAGLGSSADINSILQNFGLSGDFNTGGSVDGSSNDISVTATATAAGIAETPSAVMATADASATGTTNGNGLDLNNILSGLNLGNDNFGANAGLNANSGLDLSGLDL